MKPLTDRPARATALTEAGGKFEVTGLTDGEYVLHLLGDGFEPFTATVRIQDGATVAQNVLVKLTGATQVVEVKERAEPLSTSSSTGSRFTDKQLSELPIVEENFKESLPLTQVNDFRMTDPVTGSFSIPVPLDAVQSVRMAKPVSFDFQVDRDFRLPFLNQRSSHKIRLGLHAINAINRGNFNEVFNNITSPEFGEFTGFERRKTASLLSVVD